MRVSGEVEVEVVGGEVVANRGWEGRREKGGKGGCGLEDCFFDCVFDRIWGFFFRWLWVFWVLWVCAVRALQFACPMYMLMYVTR